MTGLPDPGTLVARMTLAFSVLTLIFSRQFALLFDENNRFFLHWGVGDGLELVGMVLVFSALAVCLASLVDLAGSATATTVFRQLFVVALACGLFTVPDFPSRPSAIVPLLWLLVLALVAVSLHHPTFTLYAGAKALAFVLSPLGVVLAVPMFTLSTWNTDPLPRAAFLQAVEHRPASERQSRTPVFFFVFDAWSFPRSTADGEFHPFFDNLRRVTSRAFVFREARSPGRHTRQSIPMMLYQERIPASAFTRDEGIFEPWLDGSSPADDQLSSLFARARHHGYVTALVGFYFPYPRIFGAELDYYQSTSTGREGQAFGRRMLWTIVDNLRYLNDPISQRIDRPLNRRINSRNHFEWGGTVVEETRWLLAHATPDTFAFLHLPFPHWPFVFNPDGTYFGHEGRDYRGPHDESGHQRTLEYLDGVIGRFVDELEAAGLFDDALIILTSDHASSFDTREARQHVPLIVKSPGQRVSRVIDTPVRTDQLGPLIDAALRGEADEAAVERLPAGR